MFSIALVCLIISLSLCYGERISIGINSNSSIYSSIQSVVHDTDTREVIIELRHTRRCDNPTFRLRLSGTALYILNLAQQDFDVLAPKSIESFFSPRRNKYHYTYPVILDPGLYCLEIIVLFCGGFQQNEFEFMCLEENYNDMNVVNLPYCIKLPASISVSPSAPRHRWVLGSSAAENSITVLPTRYQNRYCNTPGLCSAASDFATAYPYQSYDWVDGPDWVQAYKNLNKTTETSICFIGASHARELLLHGQNLKEAGQFGLKFYQIISKFPNEFSPSYLDIYNCDYTIIGYGQWPASYVTTSRAYTSEVFNHEMRIMMQKTLPPYYNGTSKVFMRSVNYNGMSVAITHCPPYDHRSPPVIDMMNSVLRRLTMELKIPYIDTNDIMGPMWDSAQDYCHPKGKVFTAEVEYILHYIFSGRNNLIISNRLVRFTDSQVVYLINSAGIAQSFPNARTFMEMGFDFGNVEVVHAAERVKYTFNGDVPSL